jgi:hypothetical protein
MFAAEHQNGELIPDGPVLSRNYPAAPPGVPFGRES